MGKVTFFMGESWRRGRRGREEHQLYWNQCTPAYLIYNGSEKTNAQPPWTQNHNFEIEKKLLLKPIKSEPEIEQIIPSNNMLIIKNSIELSKLILGFISFVDKIQMRSNAVRFFFHCLFRIPYFILVGAT